MKGTGSERKGRGKGTKLVKVKIGRTLATGRLICTSESHNS